MQLLSEKINKSAKDDFQFKAKHKNPEGGLSEAGRNAYNKATGGDLKRPQPEGGARRDSFCARMKGMKSKLTSAETARDPDSRINKSLRKWKCSYDMSEIKEAAGRCWKGYKPVPGKKPYSEDSCKPVSAGKKKTEKKADDEEVANKAMNIQQFMGQNPRRELSEEETKAVEKRKGALLPTLFPNYSDSPAAKMYSPLMPALAMGALGGGAGALAGAGIGKAKGNQEVGALLGGLGAGGVAALIAYFKRKQENSNIEEIMRRLPRGATLRDYEADPLIQKNQDRDAQMAMLAAMMRSR
jgi:hypothetical protein